ncbi:MAG: 3-dehydroquinate synthase [Bacteroidales bacterium]|nr:3-dehydroquinate synthase [Bacteroidales bacterium]
MITNTYSNSLCFILVEENTRKNCLSHIVAPENTREIPSSLQHAKIIEIPKGEYHKNLETFAQIIKQLIVNHADRNSLLINLGGGMICDIGGFAAACYKRGIDFINIPTSLLAMVDAAHGGKTGIDFNNFKNQIGVFAPAKMVVVDVNFLKTLPKDQVLSGFAEIIKMALITSDDFWTTIKQVDLNNVKALQPLIFEAIQQKLHIVEKDPNEKNIRKILNFGHTFGHALETFALENDRELLHGYAVAMGMLCELRLSERMLDFDAAKRHEISEFILSKYSKFQIQAKDFERLFDILLQDKKNNTNKIKPVLLEKIGQPRYDLTCSKELCFEAFQAYSML